MRWHAVWLRRGPRFPMTPACPKPLAPPAETGLIIQRGSGLVTHPPGNFPALSEINHRFLSLLRTSQSLAMRHRKPGGRCDFEIAPGVTMRMCWIPPGAVLPGRPRSNWKRKSVAKLSTAQTVPTTNRQQAQLIETGALSTWPNSQIRQFSDNSPWQGRPKPYPRGWPVFPWMRQKIRFSASASIRPVPQPPINPSTQ